MNSFAYTNLTSLVVGSRSSSVSKIHIILVFFALISRPKMFLKSKNMSLIKIKLFLVSLIMTVMSKAKQKFTGMSMFPPTFYLTFISPGLGLALSAAAVFLVPV